MEVYINTSNLFTVTYHFFFIIIVIQRIRCPDVIACRTGYQEMSETLCEVNSECVNRIE